MKEKVIELLHSTSSSKNGEGIKIPVSRPDITEKERREVIEVLKSPHLSMGPRHRKFEEIFREYIGSSYALTVSSGTAGLHLAIRALRLNSQDAVITTPFSFISSSNVLLFEDVLPIFVDIESDTLNIDPERVRDYLKKKTKVLNGALIDRESGRFIKAILPVHIFGHPVDMEPLIELGKEYDLRIIEDACEAIGSEVLISQSAKKWKKAGTIGDVGVFAFYPNKQITTGEGGMVVTDDPDIASYIRSVRNQGRGEGGVWLLHERLGYNYRMDELSAALGIAQMRRIGEILKMREEVASRYNELLKDVEEVTTPIVKPYVKMSWFVYVVRFRSGEMRDYVMSYLKKKGVESRPYFPPIHLQPFYRKLFGYREGMYPVTEEESKKTLALPFYNRLTFEEQKYVVYCIREGIAEWLRKSVT